MTNFINVFSLSAGTTITLNSAHIVSIEPQMWDDKKAFEQDDTSQATVLVVMTVGEPKIIWLGEYEPDRTSDHYLDMFWASDED